MKTLIVLVVVGCIGLTVLAAVIGAISRLDGKYVDAPGQVRATSPPEQPAPTAENEYAAAIRRICVNGVASANIDSAQVSIDCTARRGFSDDDVIAAAGIDAHAMTKLVFSGTDVPWLQFRLMGEFKDKYGNVTQGAIVGFRVPRSLYKKINWDAFYPRDLGSLLQSGEDGAAVVVHPAYSAAWARWLKG